MGPDPLTPNRVTYLILTNLMRKYCSSGSTPTPLTIVVFTASDYAVSFEPTRQKIPGYAPAVGMTSSSHISTTTLL